MAGMRSRILSVAIPGEMFEAWERAAQLALERGEITRHSRQTNAVGTWVKAVVERARQQEADEEAGDAAVNP